MCNVQRTIFYCLKCLVYIAITLSSQRANSGPLVILTLSFLQETVLAITFLKFYVPMASFHKVIKTFKVHICSEFAWFSMGGAIERAHSAFEGAHSEGKLIWLLSRLRLPNNAISLQICNYKANFLKTSHWPVRKGPARTYAAA